jgi:hypothetical protein
MVFWLTLLLTLVWTDGRAEPRQTAGPYQATSFKVGEVTDTTAIVWTRLTLREKRNPSDAPMVKFAYAKPAADRSGQVRRRGKVVGVEYPDGCTVADIRDAVPGTCRSGWWKDATSAAPTTCPMAPRRSSGA